MLFAMSHTTVADIEKRSIETEQIKKKVFKMMSHFVVS